MADLEQRRQQYNSNLSRQQWEADPQGKLIETLGPLLGGSESSIAPKTR